MDSGRESNQNFCWGHSFIKSVHSQSVFTPSTPSLLLSCFCSIGLNSLVGVFSMKLLSPSAWWQLTILSGTHVCAQISQSTFQLWVFSVHICTYQWLQNQHCRLFSWKFSYLLEIPLYQIMDIQSHTPQLTYFSFILSHENCPHSLHWGVTLLSICLSIIWVNTIVFLSHPLCLYLSRYLPKDPSPILYSWSLLQPQVRILLIPMYPIAIASNWSPLFWLHVFGTAPVLPDNATSSLWVHV